MDGLPIGFDTPVTVVGDGFLDAEMIAESRRVAPALIAADGAADRLAGLRLTPDAVIGDMDSISDLESWRARTRVVHLAEQDSTDFEKCLYATEAPLYVGIGFTGGRIDHSLAALNALLRHAEKRVVLIAETEVMALAPPARTLRLAVDPGATVSIYPLMPVTGLRSHGLAWPIDGLAFAPGRQSGTSNRAEQPRIELAFDGPGALVILPRPALASLAAAITG